MVRYEPFCLVTLLMQPEEELPTLIIVDEPELGLHPYAIDMIAALFKKASHYTRRYKTEGMALRVQSW